MSAYAEVVSKLPMPTQAQTRQFAEFVTSAHSWYKHLEIAPPSPFVFFFDPNAGRTMVHVSDDEVAFVDNTDESEQFHYTWQTTEAYRRRFGFWNYEAPYGRTFQYQSDEGVADTAGSGLLILSPEEEWLPIPDRLARVGTAQLTALMWYPTFPPSSSPPPLIGQEMRICCIFPVSLPFGNVSYTQDREALERLLELLPDDMGTALRALLALWTDQAYQRERAETHRAYEEYSNAERAKGRYGEASTADPGFVLYQQAMEKWEKTASRQQERVLLEPLIAGLDSERERQIEVMVGAMTQFVEMLHAAGNLPELLH
jgi:hypothetical protein